VVEGCELVSEALQREALEEASPGGSSHLSGAGRITGQRKHRLGERFDVASTFVKPKPSACGGMTKTSAAG
jgi:hypothetical protein